MAAIATGADSMMVEVYPNPTKTLSNCPQSLTLEQYEKSIEQMAVIGQAVGRWSQKILTSTVPLGLLRYQTAKQICDQTITSITS